MCIYVRSIIECSVVNFSKGTNLFEKLWITFKYCGNVFYIGCCYHPPAPRYQPAEFIAELSNDIDCILQQCDCSPIILVAGDFNGLNTDFLQDYCGLTLVVHEITHGKKILDKVFISQSHLYNTSVFKSLLKTKHMAVLVTSDASLVTCHKIERKHVNVYDVRQPVIDNLRVAICNTDWSDVLHAIDITDMYDLFLVRCRNIIDCNVPVKRVSLGPRDPEFITPLIKSLLKRRNNLRRHGKIEQANELAVKINRLIAKERSQRLARLDNASPKKLWAAVKKVSGSNMHADNNPVLCDLNAVNNFFASVSYDSSYCKQQINTAINSEESVVVEPYEIERQLKAIKPTAAGPDGLPRWLFHYCSVELADVVAHIISKSLSSGIVPAQWKTAYVSPVPKTNKPKALADYRPISVTSILSRVTEKMVVKKWLMPSIPDTDIDDQFGFRPTGSTTCALVYLMHHVTQMLETNAYVRCLCIDFSKAFDVVDHNILYAKLSRLSLPAHILQWLFSFLCDRTQYVKLGGALSDARPINRGTIQGSGIGPSGYIVMASDLRALSRLINKLFKYADDTNLLVPEHTDVELVDEFNALKQWALVNKMLINVLKTKELVFHRPNPNLYVPPLPLEDVERVTAIKLLGVLISDTLDFDQHVKFVLTVCGQRCYLLKALRWQGLGPEHVNTVFQSLIISRLSYALSAWGGFLSKQQVSKIDAFLSKAHRFGFTSTATAFNNLLEDADSTLFSRTIHNTSHCMYNLLPPRRILDINLRNSINFELPNYNYVMYKNSFIVRSVFKASY